MVSGIRSAGQPDFFHHSISHIFVLVRFLLVLKPKIYFCVLHHLISSMDRTRT